MKKPRRRAGWGAVALGGLLLAFGLLMRYARHEHAKTLSADLPAADPRQHPAYQRYDFGSDETVVDIGVQPLWLPTNLISETMRRDLVLARALEALGMKARFHGFLKGADVNAFLASGQLEVGIGGDMPALTAAATQRVHVTSMIQRGFCSIVASRSQLLADLAGQRVGYAFGSNAHFSLLKALRDAALDRNSVRMVSLDVTEMAAALAAGRIDAFSAWEPTSSQALLMVTGAKRIRRSTCSGYLYFARGLSTRHSLARQHIVAAQLRAMQWLREEPENLSRAAKWARLAARAFSGQPVQLRLAKWAELARQDILGPAGGAELIAADLKVGGLLFTDVGFLKQLGKIAATVSWASIRSCWDGGDQAAIRKARGAFLLDQYDYGDHAN